MKSLTDKELAEINRLDMAEELARARIKIAEQTVTILTLKSRLIATEIREANQALVGLKSAESHTRSERQNVLKIVQKKHKLADGWGFDPVSGEIKEGTE